jgi:hypothetical protein
MEMYIRIARPRGDELTIAVQKTDTVESVKQKIQELTRIAVAEQDLRFERKRLADSMTVEDASITDGCLLHLC